MWLTWQGSHLNLAYLLLFLPFSFLHFFKLFFFLFLFLFFICTFSFFTFYFFFLIFLLLFFLLACFFSFFFPHFFSFFFFPFPYHPAFPTLTPSLSGVPPPPKPPSLQLVLGWQRLLLPAHGAGVVWEAVRSLAGPGLAGAFLLTNPRCSQLCSGRRRGAGFSPCPGTGRALVCSPSARHRLSSDRARLGWDQPSSPAPAQPFPSPLPFPSHPRGGQARPGSGAADGDVDTLERAREPPCLGLCASPQQHRQPLEPGTALAPRDPAGDIPGRNGPELGSPAAPK